jgi:uncharacterized protein
MKQTFYQQNEDFYLNVYVQPNAKQDKVVGLYQGYIKIQITAPALENKANLYLKKWLSKEFAVPLSQISLKRGEQSRYKTFCLHAPRQLPAWLPKD